MIRHLLRLGWNRKRSFALLGAEMTVCFLIVTAIAISGLFYLHNYRLPLGFQYRDVWSVNISVPGKHAYGDPWSTEDSLTVQNIHRALGDMEEIVAVAECGMPPFLGSSSSNFAEFNGQPNVDFFLSNGSDNLDRVLGLEIVAGRWFGPEDDGFGSGDGLGAAEPVVINRRLADYVFATVDPVGEEIDVSNKWMRKNGVERRFKVVGVVSDHRYRGPLEEPYYFVFHRARLDRPVGVKHGYLPTNLLVRLRPGTPRRFEKVLHQRLRAIAPGWSPRIQVLEEHYDLIVRDKMHEYILYGIIAAFLLLMVLLGLTGVLWQSVTQRTREIGLRRAAGATRGQIRAQLVGEMLVVASAAVALGALLVLQGAALNFFPRVSSGIYALGLLCAALVLYLLIAFAALYPGWLAARIQPATALQYE